MFSHISCPFGTIAAFFPISAADQTVLIAHLKLNEGGGWRLMDCMGHFLLSSDLRCHRLVVSAHGFTLTLILGRYSVDADCKL